MAGELKAFFKGVQEDAAQAVEQAAHKMADFGESTAQNLRDSVTAIRNAESTSTEAIHAIRPKATGDLAGGGAGAGTAEASGAAGGSRIADMLAGKDGAGTSSGGPKALPDAAGPSGSRPVSELDTAGDPVDVATGDVVLVQDDVSLPGALSLVLSRSHRSSHRTGRWLGPSWASSFDQRLEVRGGRVTGAFDGGRVLAWARPDEGEEALPEHGPAWPLCRDGDAWLVSDRQRGLTWRFEHRPGHWFTGIAGGQGELPLVSVTDRAGHEINFGYAADGSPAEVTHSGGYRLKITVSSERITAVSTAGTLLLRYEYDDEGNLEGVINSTGQPLRFSYDEAGRLAGWTDRNGHSYRYLYDELGRCVRGESPSGALSGTFDYDEQPGETLYTDGAGAVTRYRRDDPFGITGVIDPVGGETRYRRDERGRVTERADALGRVTRFEFDDAGNLAAVTRPDGSAARAEYDGDCLPVTVTGPDGAVWRQVFDERGNRIAVTAPDGSVTRYGYDLAGHLASVTGPDGAVTAVTCDAVGLPTEVTGPDGAVTRYERDALGRPRRITGPDGGVTAMTWTPEGRPLTRTLPDGAAESWEWDGEQNLLRHVSPGGAVTSYEYGPFDVPAAMTWPDGTRSLFAYDREHRLTSVTHGELTWAYTYDPAGRLSAETDFNGAVTRYGWDAAGQLTSKVNAAGQAVACEYDLLGNLVSQASGDAETTFGYDPAGRLVSARNADASLEFERDALGRVTAETCNGHTVRTEYDAAGRVLSRVTPSGAVAGWSYDVAGRSAVLDSGGHELRFSYGASGLETRRDLPGGAVLAQHWDPRGRLAAQVLTGLGGPSAPSADGQVLQRRSYAYSADGLLTGLEDLLSGSRAVGLDPAGRVTAVEGPGWSEHYGYDQAGNVASAVMPQLPAPLADGWAGTGAQGPREVSGTLTRQAGTIRYRHDAAGRVVTRSKTRISRKPAIWRYTWDAENRLVSVAMPDGTSWRYSYDPLGRRIAKQHLSPSGEVLEATRFTWDGLVLAEQAVSDHGAGEEVTTWDYQPGSFAPVTQASVTALADASQEEIDRRFRAIVTDLVGAPAELVTPDGALAGHQVRTLWGNTAWDSSGEATPLRFPGQYADDETGLHYNNQRYYDPASGAYLSPDPLGLEPSPNPHAYVPNPLIEADPLGLMGCGPASGGGPGGRRPDFIAGENGTVVPTSRSRLESGFRDAGFPSSPTRAPGTQYTLPDGSLVRVMEPSGQAPLRASFTDSRGNAVNPFTGKQPMPPPGVRGAAWRQLMRSQTHVELGP